MRRAKKNRIKRIKKAIFFSFVMMCLSIAIWNEYLVYATALGVADEVYKAMKMIEYNGNDYFHSNDLFLFYYFGGHHALHHAINTGISTASSNNSIGGIGGGSGGGGGGAFSSVYKRVIHYLGRIDGCTCKGA